MAERRAPSFGDWHGQSFSLAGGSIAFGTSAQAKAGLGEAGAGCLKQDRVGSPTEGMSLRDRHAPKAAGHHRSAMCQVLPRGSRHSAHGWLGGYSNCKQFIH